MVSDVIFVAYTFDVKSSQQPRMSIYSPASFKTETPDILLSNDLFTNRTERSQKY